jgi:polysaccharide pyruvyl transferase WcaK-like protein
MDDISLVLIGGGPLMDLVEMYDLVRVMHTARQRGVPTLIAGCGMGPARWPMTRWAIAALVGLSDRIVLRDRASLDAMRSIGLKTENAQAGVDPAFAHVLDLGVTPNTGRESRPQVGMAIRDWQWKFARPGARAQFRARREELVQVWADACDLMSERLGADIVFVPMHTLHTGGDDRWLHAEVRSRVRHGGACRLSVSPASPVSVVQAISRCDVVVGMRYHSLVFAAALGIPAVAVDYTRGGKVAAFAREWLRWAPLLEVADISAERLVDAVGSQLSDAASVRQRLLERAQDMSALSRLAGVAAAQLVLPG